MLNDVDLEIYNNTLGNRKNLSAIEELEMLDLCGNPVFDLSPINGLFNLCDLKIVSRRDVPG